ncbi:uncharacterized protein E0L32_002083 [Thyridium curvatum]|uniref:Secreted protein n=1 Tax=Thyridium curvatum TaxID=1093900 RepID=A0A507AKD2_9PEZI|nr:uncharacterized protein E0L32_002050 [Thyridium curvatum]XP_030989191.1 uncharacterized protein E0L32_002083 [Thyridium curvatum]TPX07447.1 hypothetical protein E0L32_002050 [Thyridium curvatum]TPX07480.1 hypothetical protein E0L32_002083 [Thyridium curvatum]
MLLHLWAVTILMWSIGVHSKSDLQVIFQNADSFKGLNLNQQKCAVTTVYSAAWASDCKDKACFCNGPQFIADNTDKCLIQQGKYYDGMYSTDTYNGIMAFYGTECGFQAQFKAVMTQSVTYTKAYAAATSTPGAAKTNVSSPLVTGGGFPGVWPRRASSDALFRY